MKVHRHLESTGLKVRMMHRSRLDNNNCIETIDSSQAAQRVLYYIFIQPKEKKNLSYECLTTCHIHVRGKHAWSVWYIIFKFELLMCNKGKPHSKKETTWDPCMQVRHVSLYTEETSGRQSVGHGAWQCLVLPGNLQRHAQSMLGSTMSLTHPCQCFHGQ